MRILITGASGRLGSLLQGRLLQDSLVDISDHEVIGIDREIDITDFDKIDSYIKEIKPEVIIHLASLLGSKCEDKKTAYKVNVEATKHLYLVSRAYGLKRFIFTSSCAVYNQTILAPTAETENIEPKNYYGETKLLAEKELQEIGGDVIIFRIFNIYGEGFDGSLVNKLKDGEDLVLFNPDRYYRDYIDSQDVVYFIKKALFIENEEVNIFNLCSGKTVNTVQLLERFGLSKERFSITLSEESDISWGNNAKLFNVFKEVPKLIVI